jgi:hypothetical protein
MGPTFKSYEHQDSEDDHNNKPGTGRIKVSYNDITGRHLYEVYTIC